MRNQHHLLNVRIWNQTVDSIVVKAEPWKGKGKRRKGKVS